MKNAGSIIVFFTLSGAVIGTIGGIIAGDILLTTVAATAKMAAAGAAVASLYWLAKRFGN